MYAIFFCSALAVCLPEELRFQKNLDLFSILLSNHELNNITQTLAEYHVNIWINFNTLPAGDLIYPITRQNQYPIYFFNFKLCSIPQQTWQDIEPVHGKNLLILV